MTYRNLKTEQLSDGNYLVSVEIITPKKFKLLLSGEDEVKIRGEITKYLESQNATEEDKLGLPEGRGDFFFPNP